jgi:hypothetical protein
MASGIKTAAFDIGTAPATGRLTNRVPFKCTSELLAFLGGTGDAGL